MIFSATPSTPYKKPFVTHFRQCLFWVITDLSYTGCGKCMTPESAVLGTSAIYMDKIGRGYADEEEKYGLVFNFKDPAHDQERAIARGTELLGDPGIKETMRKNREMFLKDKIDPTAFMVWFIENYPDSFLTMREEPEYQYNFR